MMNIQEIFISENDNLIYKLIDLGINFKAKEKDLRKISEKIYNNKIGYIQFKDNKENLYRIYVLPKIIKTPANEKEKRVSKKKFFSYMYFSFELIEKYKNLNIKEFKHIEPFLNYFRSEKVTSTDFEHVVYLKYELVLKYMFKYFQKHKAYIVEEKAYHSQTLKHKIDLKRSIKELNKAKIHQKRKEVLIYSELAYISYQVLNYFDKKILNNFSSDIQAKLSHRVNSVQNMLKRRYQTHTRKTMKLKDIVSHRTKKLFKKQEDKKLYSYLLTLIGAEIIESEEKAKYLMSELLTFFMSPEKIYEMFVYDSLKSEYEKNEILYQERKYYLIQTNETQRELQSVPDIVVFRDDKCILVDVKWKIVKNFNDINIEDILKLERDCRIWTSKIKIEPFLIYPEFPEEEKAIKLIYTRKDDCEDSFSFNVRRFRIKLER